jgi:RNA polymerase sigma-70 factor (ECF subfamily)
MLFVCCDDRLPSQTQLVLALKFLCGFSTREIAARLFLTEANAQKAIERGRAGLEALWRADDLPNVLAPEARAVQERLPVVQSVIYLLFNEGYSSRLEEQPIRRELCDEGLRLGRLLVSHPATDAPTSWALLALLELHAARLDARSDGHGGLLLLEEQDRSRWDADGIGRGLQCLWRSGQGEELSRYHAEAAILAVHCTSPSFAETRWDEIVELYELLEARQPSPLHTLNRAIALAEWKGAAEGLRLLEAVAPPGWLAGHYLWDATHGELLRRLGRFTEAERLLARAEECAPTRAERAIFGRKLARCRAGDQTR